MDIKAALTRTILKKDGQDHIWVSPYGGTQIGKLASISWRHKFFVPQIGEFLSPISFVAWAFSGDEDQRFATNPHIPRVSRNQFPLIQKGKLMAKFFQLAGMKKSLAVDEKTFSLPWVEYKTHAVGVKEFSVQQNGELLKQMIWHIIEKGAKAPFSYEDFDLEEVRKDLLEVIIRNFEIQAE